MSTDKHIVHQVIEEARGLILKGWTTGVMARDERGIDVDPVDDLACQWCLLGSVIRAIVLVTGYRDRHNDDRFARMRSRVRDHLRRLVPNGLGFDQLNDRRGRQAVLDLFDRALAEQVEDFEDAEPA